MTLITWNVTGPIFKNDRISTESACCCVPPCRRCISIYRASFDKPGAFCAYQEVYELAVNIPAAYSFPLTVRITGGLDDDLKINGTLIEDRVYDPLRLGCNLGHYVGTAGGGTGYITTISSSPLTLTLVDQFGGNWGFDLTVCLDPDGGQNVNECPTVTEVSKVDDDWVTRPDVCCANPLP